MPRRPPDAAADPSPDPAQERVTELLHAATSGDEERMAELVTLVYAELKRLARAHMRGERQGHTLGVTGLVHEAFLKLVGQERASYADRHHFYAVASLTMRRILVNWARDRKRQKRGGREEPLSLDEMAVLPAVEGGLELDPERLLALNAALDRLGAISPRAVRVVECRYFGGLTVAETAEALTVSPSTVKREWALGRSWLRRELGSS